MPASASLTLVVGLGNPGDRYAHTRHNAGFWFVDRLALRLGAHFVPQRRFQGGVAEVLVHGRKLRLLKPDTFMNHSGRSVQAVMRYFDLPPEQLLVVHDELDLPPGIVRLKRGGGHGGHNGLRDLVTALGGSGFWRLRIGIGHPGQRDDVIDYVLRRAPAAEQREIEAAIERALEQAETLLAGDLERVMHVLHTPPDSVHGPRSRAGADGDTGSGSDTTER